MTWARIDNNKAVEIVAHDPATLFHPLVAILFEPVPDWVQVGAERFDDVWVNPPKAEPFTDAQLAEIAERERAQQREITAHWARRQRNERLKACDWTQIDDCTVDKAAWKVYRQALRDVPQQADFPDNIAWPAPPDGSENL